jgi:hypothetical protein
MEVTKMSERVRCKVYVESVTKFGGGNGQVKLRAIHSTDTPENERFTKATPSGDATFMIDNPPVVEMLQPGRHFHLDLTPCE